MLPSTSMEETGIGSDSRGTTGRKEKVEEDHQQDIDELHRQIGQLIAGRDWLKKKSSAIH